MRQSLARFSGLELSVHTRSLADFITTTSGFRFSVHTGINDAQKARVAVAEILALAPDIILANGTQAYPHLLGRNNSIVIIEATSAFPTFPVPCSRMSVFRRPLDFLNGNEGLIAP